MVTIVPVDNLDSLTSTAAEKFVSVVADLQHKGRTPRVVFTGGTAGIETLRKISALSAEIDWSDIHVFFGDERNVAVDHPDSNEGQAREALLDQVDIPDDRIHGYRLGELSMEAAAVSYREALDLFAPDGFDLHLLGLGPEGHINTLFPHTEAVQETEELVVAEYSSPKPPPERVTLTLPAVKRADRVWMLVAGEEKAEAAQQVVGRADPLEWPGAGAEGRLETVMFLADDAATMIG